MKTIFEIKNGKMIPDSLQPITDKLGLTVTGVAAYVNFNIGFLGATFNGFIFSPTFSSLLTIVISILSILWIMMKIYDQYLTKVLAVNQETNFKVNMGFSNNWGASNQAWANYVRQLYSTLEAYEIIQGEIYPIDILTSDQKLLEDENYLPDFLELEYTRAYVEKGATSEIPALQGSYTNQYSESYD